MRMPIAISSSPPRIFHMVAPSCATPARAAMPPPERRELIPEIRSAGTIGSIKWSDEPSSPLSGVIHAIGQENLGPAHRARPHGEPDGDGGGAGREDRSEHAHESRRSEEHTSELQSLA